ncbi:zinc transport system substrate-binding protein [Jeotgalicoccus aerolatus]|uniref:Zinc transport system substrate-binding protein n=1 Tax=Jeotgalicoccus aerolatus TaxID=709510 RepID=A0A1G8YKN2_9STAP|nr:zinc ABC transporter substrate-binding protein [Jeotgalicoccus aerolatus]SDK02725.1 zinc transport system substrate-binding protein [Jeotgalicoccus aerolatus]
MKKIFPLLFLLLLTLAACSNNQNSADDQTLTVYTTVFPLTSFVEQIAGDTVNVESIYPQGADMHSYEPTQKDMISYSDGDLFLTTSNELDPVASSIAETIKNDTEIIETAADINAEAFLESHHEHGHEEAHSDEEEHDHGSMDPHIWLSPSLASDMALSVKTALTELSPDNADMYNENYEALKADIEQLDEQLTQISSDPVNTDVFISHESIGYLAHQYGFNQVGINGLSNQEPSQQELTEIIDSINAEDIPYILYEPNVTSTVTDVIRSETNAEPLYFNNLESLANDDPEDATYQSMMEKNIESLDKALNNK